MNDLAQSFLARYVPEADRAAAAKALKMLFDMHELEVQVSITRVLVSKHMADGLGPIAVPSPEAP